ncbi:MAG: GTPase HflX [Candidatus Bathyarchaeia archaeon]
MSIQELKSLAESAGYEVVGEMVQTRDPDPSFQIGSGKVEELAKLVKEKDAKKIIFDNDLKPVQSYNLAKATHVEVIDRFQLILEIFARRASTKEARLQIQLAKLKYELAHAKEKVKLAKKGEQPGFMGLGAYEVDVYYETVKRQIHFIQERLRRIRKKRSLHRGRRLELGFSSVSLAGYTNAGKSSLFNSLVEENVPVDSGLFTTLSTTTRILRLMEKRVLLTDTVGFIDRLPLQLIEAFHSTLEETILSNLVLLVVDLSEPLKEVERKLTCGLDTLQKIGVSGIPIVTALNKIDLMKQSEVESKLETLKDMAPNFIPVSALKRTNIELLKRQVADFVFKDYIQAVLSLPVSGNSMSFLSWLFNRADVKRVEYEKDQVNVVFESVPWFANKVGGHASRLGGTVRKLHKPFN